MSGRRLRGHAEWQTFCSTHKPMVLLIDNDDEFRDALAGILRVDGYEVREFRDASSVPWLPSLEQAKALIVDYQIPRENGLFFAERFHHALPHVPIVLLSGFAEHPFDEVLKLHPYVVHRRKPVDYVEIAGLLPPPRR